MTNPSRSGVNAGAPATVTQAERQPSSLGAFLRYFLYLGTVGFGGPIALAGYMQRDLVEQRRWISDRDYKEGLALAQLAPGPLAAQLAIYLGWVRARVLGATLVGVAFVLPSFLMVLVIAALYVKYGGLPWMQGAFYGIGAAVIAIIARSVLKLARMTLAQDRLLWAICLVSALVTAWTASEIFWLFVGSGVLAVLVRARLRRSVTAVSLVLPWPALLMIAAVPASAGVLWTILWYFTEAGLVVFGSGLAVVPFLHGGVVQQFHWLTERQFLDTVAVSMITPGPVVITVAFIGYLVAGLLGAVVAATGIFVPCYLTVVLTAPYFHRFAGNRSVKAFVDGVTAAATGAIAGAAFVLGRRAIVDVPTVSIALVALALLFMSKRLPEPVLIVAAGVVGILVQGAITPLGLHPAIAQSASCVATPSSMTPATWTAVGTQPSAGPRGHLRLVADIALPGPANRFDYQSVDPVARRLYISHMNAGRLVVVDLDSSRVVADLGGVDRATGVLAVPLQHRLYVSAAGRHELVAFDDRTLTVVGRIGGIRFPDGIAYAPVEHKVYVSDEAGEADVVVDAHTTTKRSTIPLGGEAGNTHYDSVSHCIVVAVQTTNQLVAIDPATERVVARYDLTGSDHPHGFAIDEPGRLAFVSGEGNATLQVVDLRTMRVLSAHRVGDDPDVVAWDAGWRRLYVASESGVVSVFAVRGSVLELLDELHAPHAHTVAVDPKTHRVYLPLENVGGRPVLRIFAAAP